MNENELKRVFSRHAVAQEAAEGMLSDQERSTLEDYWRVKERLIGKYGCPQTTGMEDLIWEVATREVPGAEKVFGKLAGLQDRILNAGKG